MRRATLQDRNWLGAAQPLTVVALLDPHHMKSIPTGYMHGRVLYHATPRGSSA